MKTIRHLLAGLCVMFLQFSAFAAPGDLDPLDINIMGGEFVLATAVQPDGKIIIAGNFGSVAGVLRGHIARLNANGTLDMGFDPKANNTVNSVALQADGRILLGGYFTTLQPNGAASPTGRNHIARVNADGTLDMGFDPNASGHVNSVQLQADGRILLGGFFNSFQPNGAASPTPRQYIARVNADGTLDTGFDPKADGDVSSVAVQGDGKVLLGGYFNTLQPNGAGAATARSYIARVNADGTLDTGFDPKPAAYVFSIAVQADGKVLLGGSFYSFTTGAVSTVRPRIARLDANGTLDPGFNPTANDNVHSMAVQADGKVLLGGAFTALQPNGVGAATARSRIARVNSDGTLDPGFDPSANGTVRSVAVIDGKVLVGGDFTTLQPNGVDTPTARFQFARLVNDPATQTLSAPDATQALWQRGGAAPEVSRVTFELSTNGGASWTPLGAGIRIGTTADWQCTGLALPASGQLRACGATTTGTFNGSSGLIEQVTIFTFYTPIQQWKLTQLGDASAPDLGDTDFDGLVHLAEYALNLSPTAPSLPPAVTRFVYAEGERLRMFFTRDPARNDVTLEVQSADSPAGPWTTVAASTLGGVTTGPGYVGGDDASPGLKTVEVRDTVSLSPAAASRYLRVKVTH